MVGDGSAPRTAPSPPAQRSGDGGDRLRLYRAAVEGAVDGLVIVAPGGEMIAYNRRFSDMWPIPADVIASRSDDAALSSVLDKLVDPEGFLTRVRELYARASGESRDELELCDGRLFDRYGRALHDDDTGAYLGWAWYFRDVTEERTRARQHERDSVRYAGLAADAARLGSLVAVAQAVGEAESEVQVLRVVAGRGISLLEAQGVVLCRLDPDARTVRALTSSFFGTDLQAEVSELPVDFPLAMVEACTSGRAWWFGDRAAAVAAFPASAELYARAGSQASAAVPLTARGRVIGSLAVVFDDRRPWRDPDRELLEALASLTAQALDRIEARRAEREATRAARRLSETLQRSLLTDPPDGDLDIAVAYQPAAQEAQVGGDWYDAFVQPGDGSTTLVVGDVAGHDRDAAATMAQVRNVLRGVAQVLDAPPAAVLSALDRALDGLRLAATATAVLCSFAPPVPGVPGRRLRWCNAGHPPPLLLRPDGRVELLARRPDLLLGLQTGAERVDHELHLEPGDTLLLYTDGLIERRGEGLDEGFARLVDAGLALHGLSPAALCEALLAGAGRQDDDVALLAVRVPD